VNESSTKAEQPMPRVGPARWWKRIRSQPPSW